MLLDIGNIQRYSVVLLIKHLLGLWAGPMKLTVRIAVDTPIRRATVRPPQPLECILEVLWIIFERNLEVNPGQFIPRYIPGNLFYDFPIYPSLFCPSLAMPLLTQKCPLSLPRLSHPLIRREMYSNHSRLYCPAIWHLACNFKVGVVPLEWVNALALVDQDTNDL